MTFGLWHWQLPPVCEATNEKELSQVHLVPSEPVKLGSAVEEHMKQAPLERGIPETVESQTHLLSVVLQIHPLAQAHFVVPSSLPASDLGSLLHFTHFPPDPKMLVAEEHVQLPSPVPVGIAVNSYPFLQPQVLLVPVITVPSKLGSTVDEQMKQFPLVFLNPETVLSHMHNLLVVLQA